MTAISPAPARHPFPAGRVRRALTRFLAETRVVETRATRRDAAVGKLERETAVGGARWFVTQGEGVVAVLSRAMAARMAAAARRRATESAARVRLTGTGRVRLTGSVGHRLTDDISWNGWFFLLNQVFCGRHPGGMPALREIITDARATAYAHGAADVLDGTGLGVRFAVGSAEAVAHARAVAAAQVTRITDTTRDQLRTLLTTAVESGWSWNRTGEAIIARSADFAGKPLFPSRTFRSRAEMIAGYEINDAYEAGGAAQARELAAEGVPMEKAWLNAGDARVRDQHRANAAVGWIPLDAAFPDGSARPPTDAGCRCAVTYRPRPDFFGDEEDGG